MAADYLFLSLLQLEDYKNREKNLKIKLRDATRQNIYRGCKRNYKNYLTPDNSPDRKKSSERSETVYQSFHKGKTSPTTDVKYVFKIVIMIGKNLNIV